VHNLGIGVTPGHKGVTLEREEFEKISIHIVFRNFFKATQNHTIQFSHRIDKKNSEKWSPRFTNVLLVYYCHFCNRKTTGDHFFSKIFT
jgi:hypothetical protein